MCHCAVIIVPLLSPGFSAGVELILEWADFRELCSKLMFALAPETWSECWSDQPLAWDSGHPQVPDQLAREWHVSGISLPSKGLV